MSSRSLTASLLAPLLRISVLLTLCPHVPAQSTATLLGRIMDANGAAVANVNVTVRNRATGLERVGRTDGEGNYQIAVLPVGAYRVEVRAAGFQPQVVESLAIEVAQSVVQDFRLRVGN